MVEFTVPNIVKGILALILIVLLFLAFINPIKRVYEAFKPIGEKEPKELQFLKERCQEKIEKEQQTAGCALEIAKRSFAAGESSLVVESWVRTEIRYTTNVPILSDALDFASNTLYTTYPDYLGAVQTFTQLHQKWPDPSVRLAIADAQTGVNIMKLQDIYAEFYKSKPISLDLARTAKFLNKKPEIQQLLKAIVDADKEFGGKIKDKQIVDVDNKVCNFYTITELSRPDSDINKFRICTDLSRASIKYGCFWRSSGNTCVSCANFPVQPTGNRKHLCEEYDNAFSCESDPCNAGGCKWEGIIFTECKGPKQPQLATQTQQPTPQPAPTPSPTQSPTPTPTPAPG